MYEHDHHSHDSSTEQALTRALLFTLGFAVVEGVVGYWAGSLALLSDAGHMFTDASSLALAALAAHIARQPASRRHSWGMGRAEVLAALINALLMLAIVAGVVYGAILRLQQPVPVNGGAVFVVAALGLALNLLVLRTLTHSHQTLNTRGAILHVLGDALGSVAALGSGVVIMLTGWTPIDPILSLVICGLILTSALRLLREGLHVVMEGVPRHLSLEEIGKTMAQVPGVTAVHDLHVWQVNSDRIALSAHVVLRRMEDWLAVLAELNRRLKQDYGIDHATLQPEPLPTVPLPMPGAAHRS
ncbi:MAG: cation diffusion facilitator family transporter [Nevskiales bacterium]